jgi:hypothetical protein
MAVCMGRTCLWRPNQLPPGWVAIPLFGWTWCWPTHSPSGSGPTEFISALLSVEKPSMMTSISSFPREWKMAALHLEPYWSHLVARWSIHWSKQPADCISSEQPLWKMMHMPVVSEEMEQPAGKSRLHMVLHWWRDSPIRVPQRWQNNSPAWGT